MKPLAGHPHRHGGAIRRRALRHHVPRRARRRSDQDRERGARRRSEPATPARASSGEADSEYFQCLQPVEEERLARSTQRGLARHARRPGGERRCRGQQPEGRRTREARAGLQEPLKTINTETLVCLHISAYGRDNERAAWPGYDFLMQAEAGLMDLTGEPDGAPSRFGASVIDFIDWHARRGRAARVHPAREDHRQGLRRRREPVRRSAAPAQLHGHLVSEQRRSALAAAAQRALLAHAGADLQDGGRLDLRDVHERQLLAEPNRGIGACRPRGGRALRDHGRATRKSRDADRDP